MAGDGICAGIRTEGRIVDIVAEAFDLGLKRADLVPSHMIAVPVGPPQSHAVVASPAHFGFAQRPLVSEELLNHDRICVRLPNGARSSWLFEKDGEVIHIDVDGPITLDEACLARIAVLEGLGIGFFMEADVKEDIAAGRLERILKDWTPRLAPVSLYYPSRRNPSAALKAFVDLARGHGRQGTR